MFCAVFDKKRQDWELPKGGFEPWRRKSSGCADAGLFATARWELWEEAGWWLSYRFHYWWVDNWTGRRLPGPAPSAWVVAKCSSADQSRVCSLRRWMTAKEFAGLCKHHGDQVKLLFAVELHLDRAEFQDQLKPWNTSVSPWSPGSASERDIEMRAGVAAVESYLEQHHKGSWQSTLNNHTSKCSKVDGEPLVSCLTKCMIFVHIELDSASAAWRCSLDLPHSFTPGDGRSVEATGDGKTKGEAVEVACRQCMALLLITCPRDVVLQPLDWWIPPSTLVKGRLCTDLVQHSLPVHGPACAQGDGVDTAGLTEAAVTDCVATPLSVLDAPLPAPSYASTDQALRLLPAPARSSIDSCHAAKPAPAESDVRPRNRWSKMKSAKAAPPDSGPLLSAAG